MKKIISMISALAIAAASFTSMAFAATVPTMNVTAEKITDFSGDYADYAAYLDYGLDVYSVKFKGTGLSMTTQTSGVGGKNTTGNSIIGATMQFTFASTAVIDDEWVFERLSSIAIPTVDTIQDDMYTCVVTGTKPLYPPAKTAKTVTTDEEILLEEIIFAVDPSQPVTLTFQKCAINVGTFNAGTDAETATTYKVGGENPLAMSAPTLTLPQIPTTQYTITFKSYDGTTDISSTLYNENDAVVAPTPPTRSGYTFSHWSETVDGPAATVLATATADKTYYAVYTQDTPDPVPVESVSLDKASLDFTVGDAAQNLVATVLPANADNKEVTWSSSNTAVATVANGVVTPVGVGEATITVTTKDGNKTDTCEVTVKAAVVPVESVSLDKASLDFTVGDAAQNLIVTVLPANATNKNVTWSSSDSAVATVSGGLVTPVGAGEATITVTTEDGAKTATCKVTVIEPITVNTPVASVESGSVDAGTSVALSTTTEGATIYYTTDGSTPTATSSVYSGEITIDADVTIKAIAIKSGVSSDVATFTYTVSTGLPTIRVDSVRGRLGKTVDVAIKLENNPGIVSMLLNVAYDDTALTLKEVKDAGVLGSNAHNPTLSTNPYILYWNNGTALSDFTVNGTIVTLSFEIKDDAAVGDYPITITYDNTNDDILNFNMESVDFEIANGKVTAISFIYGDVNKDDQITAKDNIMIARYLARWKGYDASSIDMPAADVNADNSVNAKDNVILARYIAKWTGYDELPYKK